MKTRQLWKVAYRNARLTVGRADPDLRLWDPRFDSAIDVAFNGANYLGARRPGKYLEMLRRKNAVLARGGYWPGFLMPAIMCKCTPVPIMGVRPDA